MLERRYVFRPTRAVQTSPADVGLAYGDVYFAAAGVRLHGWLMPGPRPMTWVIFHGNSGNMGNYCDYLRFLHDGLGVNLFIFDYRGYGASEGRPTEGGIYQDAEAAVRYVGAHPLLRGQPLMYFGHSLGAAVAVDVATRHPPQGMVLEAPFLSVWAMARERARWSFPLVLLLGARFDSLRKIRRIHVPLLIIHGEEDETVPVEHGRRLFRAANEPKRFYAVPGGGHKDNYLVAGPQYIDKLEGFMAGLASRGRSAA